jgi:RAQPRD family integrative conjugative element protein
MCEADVAKIIFVLVCMMIAMASVPAQASVDKERIYLLQMINQLNALQPLLLAAAAEEDKFQRVRFHYTSFKDSNGRSHNGVLEDIIELKANLHGRLVILAKQPNHFKPIIGDYAERHKILKAESQHAN